jgi:hypothetical protein
MEPAKMNESRSRRGFLRTLIAAPLGAAVGPSRPPPLLLDEFYVAGYRYHRGPTVISQLTRGSALELNLEPGNAFDSKAVRISWQGVKLGYVPRAMNGHVFRLLSQGARLESAVVEANAGELPWRALRVGISLVEMRRT